MPLDHRYGIIVMKEVNGGKTLNPGELLFMVSSCLVLRRLSCLPRRRWAPQQQLLARLNSSESCLSVSALKREGPDALKMALGL